jgi:hypothetical protein
MIKKILPLILILFGVGGGIGAGIVMRPPPQDPELANPCGPDPNAQVHTEAPVHDAKPEEPEIATREYVKLNNQFVVPVVKDSKVAALVVMSLSVEVGIGQKAIVYEREPKLRDTFLQVLFDHANMGGFTGDFTNADTLAVLRRSLGEAARKVMGDMVSDVLIIDLARQDA